MEHQRGEHAHHQHHRQRLQREHELGARRLELEGQRAAAEIAEHERGAGPGRHGDGVDRIADHGERRLQLRDLEHQHCKYEGDRKPGGGLAPRHQAAVLADDEGERQQSEYADDRLNVLHAAPVPGPRS